jgi:ubiquinone/menaquinone biosynthesis C-methylase UbiE
MSAHAHAHPLFARVYDRITGFVDEAEQRQRLLEGLSGSVVEVGAGSGQNFRHYPATVTEIVAVEPEPYLRDKATERAGSAPAPVRVVDAAAEALPLDDGAADAVVFSLVLCSVPDQGAALTEARRVLRPDGQLRFFEHVISRRARQAQVQRALSSRLWPQLFGGCHLDRDTAAAIQAAGFETERSERMKVSGLPHVLGIARPTAG